MTVRKLIKRPADAGKINMEVMQEVRYWMYKFSCSREALKRAVRAVGNSPNKVKEYLGKA